MNDNDNDNGALTPVPPEERRKQARRVRERALQISQCKPLPPQMNNGEEEAFLKAGRTPISSYSKGLPHDARGEVDLGAFRKLRKALSSGEAMDFVNIPQGTPVGGIRLTGPQTGLAFDLEGPDAQALTIAPAPRLGSRKLDGETVELYWMALLRDVAFINYPTHAGVATAAGELDELRQDGLREDGKDILDLPRVRRITPGTVFRGLTDGDLQGPYLSQLLLHDIPFGAQRIDARQRTVPSGKDYMTRFEDWLAVQNGADTRGQDQLEPESTRRYIRNLRDLARYVHVDQIHQAYFNAALLLLSARNLAIDDGNPYKAGQPAARTQEAFGVLGPPALLALLTEVTSRALKAVWFQKWYVHRRMRPEEWCGRVDVFRRGLAPHYPVSPRLLGSRAHRRIVNRFGSSLLPQAFPEGSPMHPAYGTGHGTVAGACITILKAWFKGTQRLVDLRDGDGKPLFSIQVPDADGRSLQPYTGSDAGELTVDGELNKLAGNIALGRSGAGVHWRSDYTEAIRLGQRVALGILQEHSILLNEDHHFTVVDVDGNHWRIEDGEIEVTKEGPDRQGPSRSGIDDAVQAMT